MFKFTKDSALVKIWVSLILSNVYTIDDCPRLFNLRESVEEVLAELGLINE